jgi:F0F1-type ATP synthase membrane subunit b/b'
MNLEQILTVSINFLLFLILLSYFS